MKKKTRTTRVYNPDLNEYEWREVETGKYVFDETDKIAIVREYHERGCPASEIVAKYHISSSVVLYGWLDKYLNEKVCVSLPLEALRMALATLPEGDAPYLTHHSDRGCQYCSRTYVDTLKSRKIQISMTQSGDPLENAVAERANGILKSEWFYHMDPPSEKECQSVVSRIIDFYNNERPHMSVGYQAPSEAHCQSGLQKRCWKKSMGEASRYQNYEYLCAAKRKSRRFMPLVRKSGGISNPA